MESHRIPNGNADYLDASGHSKSPATEDVIHQDALDLQSLVSQYCTHRRLLNKIHHDNVHHLTANVSIHRDPLVMDKLHVQSLRPQKPDAPLHGFTCTNRQGGVILIRIQRFECHSLVHCTANHHRTCLFVTCRQISRSIQKTLRISAWD